MSNVEDIKERLQSLTNFVAEAQDRIDAGEMVNLSRLDDEVATLCDETLALPPEQAAEVQPVMGEMISKLEILSNSLREYKDNMNKKNSD